MKKKTIVLLLVLALAIGGVIGGTLAWLTDSTDPLTNTFTTSGIEITLDEENKGPYQMVPGHTIDKDPVVTVIGGSEACWLFVQLEESENYGDFLTHTMANGWTKGDGADIPDNVWYQQVDADDGDQPFGVLLNNKVTVKDGVTQDMMDGLDDDDPTLTITAYASQLYKGNAAEFTAKEAWEVLFPPVP